MRNIGTILEKNTKTRIRIQKGKLRSIGSNLSLLVLTVPCLVYFFIWHYLPMSGLVLAFKKYNFSKGIFGSDWIGFKNFEFLLSSNALGGLLKNTAGYGLAFIIVGNFCAILFALLLFEVRQKQLIKVYQTMLILPRFLSWVVIGFMSYAILSPTQGLLNQIIVLFGMERIDWYTRPEFWPFIIVICEVWKTIGLSSIMYYAALMAIDTELFEAAQIDGASKIQQMINISIPSLLSLFTILMILQIGNIFRGDFGLFYQIPRDVGVLYPTTDIIDTYVYRGLRQGSYAIATAVGLFQSVMGLVMVLTSNYIVKKIDPEKSLF